MTDRYWGNSKPHCCRHHETNSKHIRLPAEQVQLQASRKPRCYPVPCHPWPPSLPDEKAFIFQKSVRREQRLWILSPSLEEDMLMLTCHHLFAHSWGRMLSLHLASAIEVCMFQELGQAFIGSASAFSPGKWDWHKVHSHLPPELRGKSQFRTEWKTFYPGNWKPASVYLGTEPSVPPKQCAGTVMHQDSPLR